MEPKRSLPHLQVPATCLSSPRSIQSVLPLTPIPVPQIDYFFLCDSEYCGGDGCIVGPVISFFNGLLNVSVLGLTSCAEKHDYNGYYLLPVIKITLMDNIYF